MITRPGASALIRCSAAARHSAHPSRAAKPSRGLRSAAGQPNLTTVVNCQPRPAAIRSTALNHGMASESPNRTTRVAAVRTPNSQVSTCSDPLMHRSRFISDMNLDRCISGSEQVETCEFGVRTAATRVVLFGDSDAIQWFNAVERIAAGRGWQLTTVVKFGCPAADLRPREGFAARDGCAEWRAAALQRIKALAPGLVIMASATAYIRESRPADAASFSDQAWQAATRRTLETLAAAGIRVVAIRATPLPPFDVPTCLARALRHQSS